MLLLHQIRISCDVCLLVSSQIRALGEPLEAVWKRAYVRFFTCVRSQVSSEVEVERKPLVTDVTFVGLLTGVDKLVPLEFGVVQESLVAALDLADEHSFTVGHLMLPVGALVAKYLQAIIYRALIFLIRML